MSCLYIVVVPISPGRKLVVNQNGALTSCSGHSQEWRSFHPLDLSGLNENGFTLPQHDSSTSFLQFSENSQNHTQQVPVGDKVADVDFYRVCNPREQDKTWSVIGTNSSLIRAEALEDSRNQFSLEGCISDYSAVSHTDPIGSSGSSSNSDYMYKMGEVFSCYPIEAHTQQYLKPFKGVDCASDDGSSIQIDHILSSHFCTVGSTSHHSPSVKQTLEMCRSGGDHSFIDSSLSSGRSSVQQLDVGSFLIPEQKAYEPETVPDFYSDEWLVPLEDLPSLPSESFPQPHLQQHQLPDDLQDLVLDDEALASLPLQSANNILDDLILSTAESDTSSSSDFSPQAALPLFGDVCLSDTCVDTSSPGDELRAHCSSQSNALSKSVSSKRRRPTPYSRTAASLSKTTAAEKISLGEEERRERKRHQNKMAATRYRQKKKHELSVVAVDEDQLERKNRLLKDRVISLTKEVDYLRQLMRQVFENQSITHSSQQFSSVHSTFPLTPIS